MLHQVVLLSILTVFGKHDNSRLDTLVHVALAEGRWQHDDTGVAFFGEAVNAIVVIFVVHPKFIFLGQDVLSCALLHRKHRQFNGRFIEYHVKHELNDSLNKADKVRCSHIVLKHLQVVFVVFKQ